MSEMRSEIGETIAGSEWSGEVKTRCSCLEIPERRRGRGVTRGTQPIVGPRGRAGSWAWVEGIGAPLNAVAQGVERQPFVRM